MTDDSNRAQLILVVTADAGDGARHMIERAKEGGPVVSVIIRPADEAQLTVAAVAPLIAAAQSRGIAALVADDAKLAHVTGADGVHLAFKEGDNIVARYDVARRAVGDGQIVGVDAGHSRDAAMRAGEAGADYIAFPATVDQGELIEWWSSVFEVPVVALDVVQLGDARVLADMGADFIAVPSAAMSHIEFAMFADLAGTGRKARPEEIAS